MAKAPRYDAIATETPFGVAARDVVSTLFETAFSFAPSVLHGDDTRAVHDMRVGIRRLRSALTSFEKTFRRKPLRALARSIRRLGRKLGDVRDADVHLATLRGALGGAPDSDRPGIAYTIDTLLERRRAALAAFAIELSQFDRGAFERVITDA